jgi:LacI family transcriptional regulator
MTIAEIAKLAGVSIGTVDRVLHNRGRVAPRTIEKIMQIVEDHNYQPNTFARNLKLSKKFTIGVIIPSLHSEFGYWQLIYDGVLKAVKELSQLAVSIELMEYDRRNPTSFLRAGDFLFHKNIDAVLIAPLLPNETSALIDKYPQLPYAFIDSPLPCDKALVTVAQNPFRGGFLAGRMMKLLSPNGGTYIIIQTHKSAYNSSERARGFKSYFSHNPDYHILEVETTSDEDGENKIEEMYRQHKDLQGIFIVNNAVIRFANRVVLLGRKNQTIIIGYDIVEQNRQAMLEGKVDCLISQRPEFQGYTAIYQLYRKGILNQKPDKNIPIPIDIILSENIQDNDSYNPLSAVKYSTILN